MPTLEKFAHPDWTKIWAGNWSFLTCTHFGEQYTQTLIVSGHIFMSQSIFFVTEGRSSCFMRQSDRDIFGQHLANVVAQDLDQIHHIATTLKKEVDKTLAYMKEYQDKKLDKAQYQAFWERILEYYIPHVNVKYVVDYLAPQTIEKYLPILEEARVYAEPVFKNSEDFMRGVAKHISDETGYPVELVLCFTKEELYTFFDTGVTPDRAILQQRYAKSSLVVDPSGYLLVTGDEVTKVEELVNTVPETTTLKGSTAFPGRAQGTAKVILDPTKADHFQEGDILVTGMTRPEYLPIMKKAAGFITDAGGILSHAAITARELKKPCIIGTNMATKVIHDGYVVELDADKGIVTILNKA